MVRRVVLLQLKPETSVEEAAKESKRALTPLPGVLSVATGAVPDNDEYNFAITLDFDDLETVAAYVPHPDHRKFVDEYLLPRTEARKALNVVCQ
jgi:antibiotic biosynthesis monooxygenase (ABM) superfamily enzyme